MKARWTKDILNIAKGFLARSPIFWKLRHWIDKDVFSSYLKSYKEERRGIYVDLLRDCSRPSVFEFGCFSGPNLYRIVSEVDCNLVCGWDINQGALDFATKAFNSVNSVFRTNYTDSEIRDVLQGAERDSFDLAIFDRVLYILSEEEIVDLFSRHGRWWKKVVIDDFISEAGVVNDSVKGYQARDYAAILKVSGFEVDATEKSRHKLTSDFMSKYAKIMIGSRGSV